MDLFVVLSITVLYIIFVAMLAAITECDPYSSRKRLNDLLTVGDRRNYRWEGKEYLPTPATDAQITEAYHNVKHQQLKFCAIILWPIGFFVAIGWTLNLLIDAIIRERHEWHETKRKAEERLSSPQDKVTK